MGYNCTIVSAALYGEHWRRLRRFCAVEIFSAACLRDSSDIRRDEVRALLRKIYVELVTSGGNDFIRLKLQPLLYGLTFNILMSIVAGKREEDDETKELFDLDGYFKRAKKLTSKLDKLMQRLVDEHRRNRGKTELEKTMITHLLSLQESEPEHYTDDIIKGLVQVRARIFNSYDIESLIGRIKIDIIKGFIQVMLLAGTDTTAVTLEWAMANLLNHPEESDTGKCPYLTNVISETLRLYPAAPLLVPHASSADCEVAGFDIPRRTWLFVNAWAIQRDPKVWDDDPEAFKPERFESEAHRGKFLPFGIGRRACPGMGLAQLVLSLALGSLIQCFDWERNNDVAVDMSEGRGITMPKAVPLVAKCKSLPILDKVVL
ncbi:unnamed protein product [Arabidopsis lyrata]|nr:unnamed protein product [Arabidopsis lyrata]